MMYFQKIFITSPQKKFNPSSGNSDSILTFKSSLKTYLFKLAFSLYFVIAVFVVVKFSLCTYLVYCNALLIIVC